MKYEQNLYSNEEMFLNIRPLLAKRWKASKLPVVFYHTTFIANTLLIIREQKIIANKGNSICKEKNGLVSLSDRLTKGIIEFFGNVVFEFNALSLYMKNKSIIPRYYRILEDEVDKYDELPFFENEWVAHKEIKFDLEDINKILFITSRGFRESAFEDIIKILKGNNIEYCFLSENWLPDNILPDITRYFFRVENWRKFINEKFC